MTKKMHTIVVFLAVLIFGGILDTVQGHGEGSQEPSLARLDSSTEQAKVLVVSCRAYASDRANSPRREETKKAAKSGFRPSLGSSAAHVQLIIPLGRISWQAIKRLPFKLWVGISKGKKVSLQRRLIGGKFATVLE